MAKTATQWFAEYGESHQNPINKTIHWIAVPVIFFTVVGLLWTLPVPDAMAQIPLLNWATLGMVVASIFYFMMSIQVGVGMVLFMAANVAILQWYTTQPGMLPLWQLCIALFVIMWIFQFIGHAIEGKKPSFFKDLQFLLVGPAWLLGFILKKLGIGY